MIGTLFSLKMRTFLISGPPLFAIGPLQGSLVPLELVAMVGDAWADKVGKGMGVGEGSRVGLGTSVDGIGVAVGIAAIVIATMVLAAAIAEAWIRAGSMVGVACGPQALSKRASVATTNRIRFIFFLHFFFRNMLPGLLLGLRNDLHEL